MLMIWTVPFTAPDGTPPRKLPGGIDNGIERAG
jgi:hypothetical protein